MNDCLVFCSEERERLIEGAAEHREEEWEKSRPGNLKCNPFKGPIKAKNGEI